MFKMLKIIESSYRIDSLLVVIRLKKCSYNTDHRNNSRPVLLSVKLSDFNTQFLAALIDSCLSHSKLRYITNQETTNTRMLRF